MPEHKDLTFKLRRDDSVDWAQKNPVLADGEPGYEKDTGRLKVGNGVTAWAGLTYTLPSNLIQTMINNSITAAGGSLSGGSTNPGDDGTSFLLLYENAKV